MQCNLNGTQHCAVELVRSSRRELAARGKPQPAEDAGQGSGGQILCPANSGRLPQSVINSPEECALLGLGNARCYAYSSGLDGGASEPGYSLLLLIALNIVEVHFCRIEALWGGALHGHGKRNAVQMLQRGCLQQQESFFLEPAGYECQSAIAMQESEMCQSFQIA